MITSKKKIALPTAIPAIAPGDKPVSSQDGIGEKGGVHFSWAVNWINWGVKFTLGIQLMDTHKTFLLFVESNHV